MMSYDFQTITHGKWILAGEHAVLRGHPALVFPVHDKKLTLTYHQSAEKLSVLCLSAQKEGMEAVLWRTVEEGMTLLNGTLSEIRGQLIVQNNIPIGSGMGASAALCVAVARWFVFINLLPEQEQLDFAKELEHIFHGKSSGVDIAGAASLSGVYFKQGIQSPLPQTWQPQWYMSFCGDVGLTSECILKVQALWQENDAYAQLIDEQMNESVELACRALKDETVNAKALLAEAMNMASSCFLQWGLITEKLEMHMQQLRDKGALAVKPTGSGGGGHVLSLWGDKPSQIPFQMMKI